MEMSFPKAGCAPGTGKDSVTLHKTMVTVPIVLWWSQDPQGPTAAGPPLLTHPWEVFEVLDLCGNVTVRACGQRAGAPTVLHRQPQKGFAQIYSKVQPWEVK